MTTPAGYQPPRYPELRVANVASWKRGFGDNADTAPDQLDGLIIDFVTVFLAVAYEILSEVVAQHHYPTAEGLNLDSILALFRSPRRAATFSKLQLIVYGDDATTVVADSTVATIDTGDVFVIDDDIAISSGSVWVVFIFGDSLQAATTIDITLGAEVTTHVFAFGGDAVTLRDQMAIDLDTNINVAEVHGVGIQPDGQSILVVKMNSGFSTAITSSSGSDVDDHIGAVGFSTAEDEGAISGAIGTVATVISPETGWEGVVNIVDATLGKPEETDTNYRGRHELVISGRGRATPRGLAGTLFDLDGVEFVRIFENLKGELDPLGRPSHSFEVLIEGGESDRIAEEIWLNHTTGTQSTGTEVHVVQDERGQIPVDRNISLTRPLKKFVHMGVIVFRGERFPNLAIFDLKVEIAEAITQLGETLEAGDNVYIDEQIGRVTSTITGRIGDDQPGRGARTQSVTVTMGVTATPSEPTPPLSASDIIIGDREWAQFAAARIDVEII